jgi:flagellar biogenesis protein FliO
MSLKIFHLIFITAAVLLAFGCAAWGFKRFFSAGGGVWDLVFGLGSLAVAVALVLYERYFLKKLKRVGYL